MGKQPFARTVLLAVLLGLAPLAGAAASEETSDPNPAAAGFNAEGSDAEAIALADRTMEAMGGRAAWDATRFLTWRFFGRRFHVWDKHTGDVRIEGVGREDGEPYTILMNVHSREGRAWRSGEEITEDDALAGMLDSGESAWINDSYWLVMPYKLKDTGVTLTYLGKREMADGRAAEAVQLTFEGVGRTPENKYHVYVAADSGLVEQWDFFDQASDEEPRFTTPWHNWQPHGEILLSDNRGQNGHTDVAVFAELPAEVFTSPDPVDFDAIRKAQARAPVPVPEASEKAMRYYRSGNGWWWVNQLWGLAIPALFLFTGFSARIRDWAKGIGRKWFFVIAVYMVIFNVINWVISLPLSYYQGFVRQHAYDLSNQTFNKWFGDSVKGMLVGLVVAVLFTWVPYMLLKKSPRRWWFYTGLLAVPFLFFVAMVSPIWVAPLFNDFGPMQDKELESRILALAERSGIEGSRVYEVDKSVDTEAVNAYVSGFANTKRIVLWDTIIAKLESDELLFVMGHEMGHYVLKHVIVLVCFFSAVIMLGLYLVYRTSRGLIDRYGDRFRFKEMADIASLPLLILLFGIFSFVFAPVVNGFTRHFEHEADRFGLELTRANRPAALAFAKLQEENLGNPRPGLLYKLWRSSHPILGDRIDFCNSYRPWETGDELKYSHRFSD